MPANVPATVHAAAQLYIFQMSQGFDKRILRSLANYVPYINNLDISSRDREINLCCLEPLRQLQFLTELNLNSDFWTAGYIGRLKSADAALLGQLTSLKELRLFVNDLPTLLPHLSSLSNLKDLHMHSCLADLGMDIPQFSTLACLQNLTSLTWSSNGGDIPDASLQTLSAICSITRLATLTMDFHQIRGSAAVKLLAAMPCLTTLTVDSLHPEDRIVVACCAWEHLVLQSPFLDLKTFLMLPLSSVKRLELDSPWITLGLADDNPAALLAVARDLYSTAQILACATNSCFGWKLEWEEIPQHPCGCVFTGFIPLNDTGLLTDIELVNWHMDQDTALQLTKSVPALRSLTLEGCRISLGALTALGKLARLRKLYCWSPVSAGAAVEALSLLRDSGKKLSICIRPGNLLIHAEALEAAGGQLLNGELVIM